MRGDREPVDPDVDLGIADQRRELAHHHPSVLGAVAVGGGLGALARYWLTQLLPTPPGQLPWSTLLTNVLGCLLIGVLMVLITEVRTAHRLVRPFLGVGVLGGFTTFSTYAVEIRELLAPGTVGVAVGYLAATLAGALLAVVVGVRVTRALAGVRR
ncbi:fluoride efflux transporter CrcB [Actinophytocola sediminis]